jgi:hypothetical protein
MAILERLAGPHVEAVTLAEAKSHLRLDSSDEDLLVESLIVAAREYIEEQTRLSLVATRWLYRLDGFPLDGGEIELPRRPMILSAGFAEGKRILALSPSTADPDGSPVMTDPGTVSLPPKVLIADRNVSQFADLRSPVLRYWNGTVNENLFEMDSSDGDFLPASGNPPTLRLYNAWNWPILATWRPLPVEVEYTAGYGFDGSSVPRPLKLAILLLVAHWYQNREAASIETGLPIPFAVENILRLWDSGEYK